MFQIDHAIALSMSFFKVNIEIIDTHWTKNEEEGIDQQSILATRKLYVPVDPSNSKRMVQIFGGSVSDGDIMIFSADPLYIEDVYKKGARGKQSFVDYGDLRYRVAESADWTPQAGIKVYLAKRHIKQELV